MSVGGQASTNTVNGALTSISVGMRNLMQQITNLSTWVNGQGNGLQMLVSLGFASTANTSNPGGVSDAQLALNMIAYMNTVAGVYCGTVQQGGSNGTAATTFNFNQELSQLWSGQ